MPGPGDHHGWFILIKIEKKYFMEYFIFDFLAHLSILIKNF